MASLEFSGVVLKIVEQYIKEHISTAMPAKVVGRASFGSQQVVDVKPILVDTYLDSRGVELPPILDVPVILPAGGGGLLSFPVAIGDTVLIISSMRNIDEWKDSREQDNTIIPKDRRSFNLADAIAIPGLFTKNTNLSPSTENVELRLGDSSFSMTPGGVITVTNGSETITADNNGNIELDNGSESVTLTSSGDFEHSSGAKITATGDVVTASGVSLDNHQHVINSGSSAPGPTAPPTPTT